MVKREIEYLPMTGCWENRKKEIIYVESCLSICESPKYNREIGNVAAKNLRTGMRVELLAEDFLDLKRMSREDELEIEHYVNGTATRVKKIQ